MSDKESFVIGSKVKALIKEKGLMCSGELPAAVSDKVRELLEAACVRTTANKRSTVRAHDL
jgi:histone H3/H4